MQKQELDNKLRNYNLPMKKAILFFLIFSPIFSLAANNAPVEIIAAKLNAKTMRKLIQPKKVAEQIYTPYAAWFVRNNDIAPSCALIDKDNLNKILEMISPSDGQFENCHQAIQEPVINFIHGSYYATYSYVVEETRAEFSQEYQLVKLTKDGFIQCKEESAISDEIRKSVNKKKINLASAVQNAIMKIGCTTAALPMR